MARFLNGFVFVCVAWLCCWVVFVCGFVAGLMFVFVCVGVVTPQPKFIINLWVYMHVIVLIIFKCMKR